MLEPVQTFLLLLTNSHAHSYSQIILHIILKIQKHMFNAVAYILYRLCITCLQICHIWSLSHILNAFFFWQFAGRTQTAPGVPLRSLSVSNATIDRTERKIWKLQKTCAWNSIPSHDPLQTNQNAGVKVLASCRWWEITGQTPRTLPGTVRHRCFHESLRRTAECLKTLENVFKWHYLNSIQVLNLF